MEEEEKEEERVEVVMVDEKDLVMVEVGIHPLNTHTHIKNTPNNVHSAPLFQLPHQLLVISHINRSGKEQGTPFSNPVSLQRSGSSSCLECPALFVCLRLFSLLLYNAKD